MRIIIIIAVITAGPQPYWRTRMMGTRVDDSVHWSRGHNDKVCSFTGGYMKVECTTKKKNGRVWISFEWNIYGTLYGLNYMYNFSSNFGYKEVAFGPLNIQSCVIHETVYSTVPHCLKSQVKLLSERQSIWSLSGGPSAIDYFHLIASDQRHQRFTAANCCASAKVKKDCRYLQWSQKPKHLHVSPFRHSVPFNSQQSKVIDQFVSPAANRISWDVT